MGVNQRKVLILNGSPRAPRSNSKRYAALFTRFCGLETETMDLLRADPGAVAQRMETVSDVLLVFPLYADAIPVPVLRAFKALEEAPPRNRPTVSVLVNCGFLEPEQCDMAVAMVELFCKRMGWPVGSVLELGSGEAILDQPFRVFAKWKIRALARAVAAGRHRRMKVTMPISKKFFPSIGRTTAPGTGSPRSRWPPWRSRDSAPPEQGKSRLLGGEAGFLLSVWV